jgi:iron complex transport system ATP-binding protein
MGRIAMRGAFRAPSAVDRAACAHAIAAMGIAHLSTRAITDLSGGERQLAMIARALAQSAPLLIMDEPTASLDVANQALVLTAIARLASAGRAVLFCSHDPNHALDLADGVILLKAGQTVAEGKPHATLTPDRLEALYGTRFALARTAEGTMRCLPLIHPDTPQETR